MRIEGQQQGERWLDDHARVIEDHLPGASMAKSARGGGYSLVVSDDALFEDHIKSIERLLEAPLLADALARGLHLSLDTLVEVVVEPGRLWQEVRLPASLLRRLGATEVSYIVTISPVDTEPNHDSA